MNFKKSIATFVTGLILTINLFNLTHNYAVNNDRTGDYCIGVFSDDDMNSNIIIK